MQRLLLGTAVFLMALARLEILEHAKTVPKKARFLTGLAWPVHAQNSLPYTTYTSFNQLLEGRNARYPTITRVSYPGTTEHPVYTGFFFYQCLQFDTTGRYLLGMRSILSTVIFNLSIVPMWVLSISETAINGPRSEKQQLGAGSRAPGFNGGLHPMRLYGTIAPRMA